MPVLRCDEAAVYAVVAAAAVSFLLFAALRAAVHLVGALFGSVARRLVHPAAERVACGVFVVIAQAVFGNGSALLPALLLLATATSGAFCRSLRSFRWLWVVCFVGYGVLLFHGVGPRLWEDVDVGRVEWAVLVRGQHVVLPTPSSIASAATSVAVPGDRPTSRFLHSYYDAVQLVGSATASVAISTPFSRTLSAVGTAWWQQSWVGQLWRQGTAAKSKKRQRRHGVDMVPTYHITASGDDTLLTHYAEESEATMSSVQVRFMDSIYLVGQRSRLEHSHVHCLAPNRSLLTSPSLLASVLSPPCLRLHRTTTLRNVTLHWTAAASTTADSEYQHVVWQPFHAAVESAWTCAEVQAALLEHVQQQYSIHRDSGEDVDAPSVSVAAVLDCVDDVTVSQLPRQFVAAAPLAVRFSWQAPTYLHHAQEALFVVADRVVVPLALYIADFFALFGNVMGRLFGYFGGFFVDALPHAWHAAEQAAVFAGGVTCGPEQRTVPAAGTAAEAQATVLHAYAPAASRCAAFARSHATHAAFKAGVRTRKSVLAVCSTVADTMDVFPGVWTVYRWAWQAEVRMTRRIVSAARSVGVFVFVVLPPPLLCMVVVVAQHLAVVLRYVAAPLRLLGRWLSRLPLLPYFSRLSTSIWALELRVLRYEWSVLQHVGEVVVCKGQSAAQWLLQRATYLSIKGSAFMTRYGQTSFSMHLVVTVLQTLLLLTAMRNEMRELVDAERQRSSGQRAPLRFLQRLLPSSCLPRWLPLQSISAHVNGFVLLVRAHHQACMSYLLLHAVGALVLVGLSVLPFMGKLYSLSLRYVLPWMSAKAFLVFFDDPPSTQVTVVLVVARMALATTLQHTIGEFLYHIIKDILIAGGLMGVLTLALWAWPQRTELAQQVATAIADSLQGTPVPTPQRLAHESVASSRSPAPAAEEERQTGEERGVSGGGAAAEAGAADADAVTKRIDLSEAT